MLNNEHDVLTIRGFLHALKNTLRLKRNGLLWCGVPCASSFACSERVMLRSKFKPTRIVNLYVCMHLSGVNIDVVLHTQP